MPTAIRLPNISQNVKVDTRSLSVASNRAVALSRKLAALRKEVTQTNTALRGLGRAPQLPKTVQEMNKAARAAAKMRQGVEGASKATHGAGRAAGRAVVPVDRFGGATQKAGVHADTAREKVQGLGRTIRALPRNKQVDVKARVQGEAATAAKLKALTHDRHVDVGVKIDKAQFAEAMAVLAGLNGAGGLKTLGAMKVPAIGASAMALLPVMGSMVGELATMSQSLLISAAAMGAAATAAGTLALGLSGVGEALKNMEDPKKFAEAMKGLSTEAKHAVLAVKGLRGTFKDLKKDVQSEIFRDLDRDITKTGNALMKKLRPALKEVGHSWNVLFKEQMRAISSKDNLKNLNTIVEGTATAVQTLSHQLHPLLNMFTTIAATGMPVFNDLGKSLIEPLQKLDATVKSMQQNGSLKKMMEDGVEMVKRFGGALVTVGKVFWDWKEAADMAGISFLSIFENLANGLHEIFGDTGVQVALGQAFQGVAAAIGGVFGNLKPLKQIIVALGRPIKEIGEYLGTVFSHAMPYIADILTALSPVAGAIITALGPFVDVVDAIGPPLVEISKALAPILDSLATFINKMVRAFAPMAGRLLHLIAIGLGAVYEILKPVFETMGEWFDSINSDGAGAHAVVAGIAAAFGTLATLKVAKMIGGIAKAMWGLVAASWPLTLLVVGVGALAAGLVYAYETVKPFREAVDKVWKLLGEGWNDPANKGQKGVSGFFHRLKDAVKKAWPTIKVEIGKLAKLFWEWVKETTPKVLRQLGKWAGDVAVWIRDVGLPKLWGQIKEWGSSLHKWITTKGDDGKTPVESAKDNLKGFLDGLVKWVKDEGLPTVLNATLKWGDALVDWISPKIGPAIVELWKFQLGILKWITVDAVPYLFSAMAGWGKALVDWIITPGEDGKRPSDKAIANLGTFMGDILGWLVFEGIPAFAKALMFAGPLMVKALFTSGPSFKENSDKFKAGVITWITLDFIPACVSAVSEWTDAISMAIWKRLDASDYNETFKPIKDGLKLWWDLQLRPVISMIATMLLGIAGWILDAWTLAFSWIPGLGEKLQSAQKSFHTFADGVMAALNGIDDKDITVNAKFRATYGGTGGVSTLTAQQWMKKHGTGSTPYGVAQGGVIPRLPGSKENKDSVNAMLMPGEFVIRKDGSNLGDAYKYYATKRKDLPVVDGYAKGGPVADTTFLRLRKPSNAAVADTANTMMAKHVAPDAVAPLAYLIQQKLDADFKKLYESGGGPIGPGSGAGMNYVAMTKWVNANLGGAHVTSSYRPGAITALGHKSRHSMGKAVDIAPPSKGIFNKILATFGSAIKQLFYSPMGINNQIVNGRRVTIDKTTYGDHFNHVHWAMAKGGKVPTNEYIKRHSSVADMGTTLDPGFNLLNNKLGKPEPLVRADLLDSRLGALVAAVEQNTNALLTGNSGPQSSVGHVSGPMTVQGLVAALQGLLSGSGGKSEDVAAASRIIEGRIFFDASGQAWIRGIAQDVVDGNNNFNATKTRMGGKG